MIREDLVAERVAIASYQEIVRWLADTDPTTRRMIEGILAVEEEHADDLLNLLDNMGASAADTGGDATVPGEPSAPTMQNLPA
jgi:bacterioferritin